MQVHVERPCSCFEATPLQLRRLHTASLLALALAAGLFCGCGSDRPPLAPVRGVVTLDGKPLADAEVIFAPDKGRHSAARTNAEGKYELKYLPGVPGAMLGHHTVRISRFDPDTLIDSVPRKYNAQGTLTAEVAKGSNEINFTLTSK